MSYTTTNDPLEAAMNPEAPARSYFGEVTANTNWYFCVLERGAGKVVFDPTQHSMDRRRVAISIEVAPLPSERVPAPFPIQRDMVDFEKEWASVSLPSLKRLGTDISRVKGKWVHVKLVKTSEYTAKDGTLKDKTGIQFVEIFPDRAACEAARDATFRSGPDASPTIQQAATPPSAPAPITPGLDRATAAKLLPGLWAASQQNADTFLQRIASVPDLAAHFGADAPEVTAFTQKPF